MAPATQPVTPSMTGAPFASEGLHETPCHLSVPERANCALSSRCLALRKFTTISPCACTAARLREVRAIENEMSGGSIETL